MIEASEDRQVPNASPVPLLHLHKIAGTSATMDATLAPIIQGLTVAGALGRTWLGVRLSKGREERQWRRDRCLDAYAEVLTLSTQVLEKCEDPTRRTKRDPEKEKLLWAKNAELQVAYQKAVLLAPTAVQEHIADLVGFCSVLAWSSADPEQFSGDWEKMVVHHGHLVNRVVRVARPDLGSPGISRQSWWRA
jgi:hypothetical protein